MIRVRFVSTDGRETREVEAAEGARLLDVAQADGQPLEGTCEGQMACSTCHVLVDPADFARLPEASEMEEDLLDLAAGVTRHSRLACQIWLEAGLESLTVRIPARQPRYAGALIKRAACGIGAGGSRADGAVANLVRSGRKQPQRFRTGSFRLPPPPASTKTAGVPR